MDVVTVIFDIFEKSYIYNDCIKFLLSNITIDNTKKQILKKLKITMIVLQTKITIFFSTMLI